MTSRKLNTCLKATPLPKAIQQRKRWMDSFDTHIPSFEYSNTTNPAWQFQTDCRRPSNQLHLSSTTNGCISTWRQLVNITSSHGRKWAATHAGTYPCQHPHCRTCGHISSENRSSGAKGWLFVLWSDLLHLLPSLPSHLHWQDRAHSEGMFWWTSLNH